MYGDTKIPDKRDRLIAYLNIFGGAIWLCNKLNSIELGYGQRIDGTVYNRTALGTNLVRSSKHPAAYFNGTSSYVDIPNNALLNPTAGITVYGWFNAANISGQSYPPIAKKVSTVGYTLEINHTNNTLAFWAYLNSAWKTSPTYTLSINTKYHACGVYDGAKLRLYVNGVEVGTGTAATGNMSHGSGSLYIGKATDDASRLFKGYIGPVGVIPRVLSAAEVYNMFLLGRQY